jgi:hypothetical protein
VWLKQDVFSKTLEKTAVESEGAAESLILF